MDTLDKFFQRYSYKFPKGYPDINDPSDKKMLIGIIENVINDSVSNYENSKKDITLENNILNNEKTLQEDR